MKQFYLLSTLLCALAISNPVSAQITIDEVKTDPSERILKNEVRPTTVDAQSYFSRARYRAERAAIRKERNTLEFGGGILGSVASYSDSWIETSGGDNSIGLAATLFLHHTFTKQRFTIETKFDAKFGYNRMNIERRRRRLYDQRGHLVQEPGRISDFDQSRLHHQQELAGRLDHQIPQPVRQRLRVALAADGRRSEKYLYVAGLPRHIGRFHLHLSPRAFSDQDQPLADRLSAVFVESAKVRSNRWDDKPAGRLTAFRMRTKPRNTRAVPQSRSTSTGRSAKGIFRYRTTLFSFMGWMSNLNMKNRYTSVSAYEKALQAG